MADTRAPSLSGTRPSERGRPPRDDASGRSAVAAGTRRPLAVTVLAVVLAAEAITAIPSGLLMIWRPDGSAFGAPPEMLATTPFDTWLVPGILLVTCLGLLPLVAAILVWRGGSPAWARPIERLTRHRLPWAAAGASAVAILVWIVTQMVMLSSFAWLQAVYLVWGATIGLLAVSPAVRRHFALHGSSAR